MLGFSVYLNQSISESTGYYLAAMKSAGFTGVFTSLQIPEEDASRYVERIHDLAMLCQQNELRLTADVSAQALQRIELDVHEVKKIKQLGLTALRLDDGFSMQTIAELSQAMPIALNASTITVDDVQKLRIAKANFEHLEAWHNYYPRPETGLDQQWVLRKNQWLHAQGFKTMAFVSGDTNLRGPLKRGLPTLEKDRGRHPLAAAIDLLKNAAIDHVYIGDPGLSKMTRQQFYSYYVEQTLLLPMTTDRIGLFNQTWHNRADVARDVVRLKEGRMRQLKPIVAQENSVREVGTVTEDNQDYGRYMGELQIVKRPLPASKQVNVIGRLAKNAVDLLPIIGSNQAIQFVKSCETEQ